ncbi:MAG: glycosyltransferase family 2 protein [Solirubrobacterales bacterium]|nr:glycosyltransferase family 2 protein [Solirubrobacterales bacterium]
MTDATERGGDPVLEPNDSPNHAAAPFFSSMRKARALERLPPGASKRGQRRGSAVLTIVQNEPFFFPIWLSYYSRFFAAQDIYVLDHDSDDGSTEGTGFNRVPLSHDTLDFGWMVSAVEAKQRELLERYDVVVVVDVDEIVAPDPRWGTLEEYLARFNGSWVECLGYELIHLHDSEPPLTPDQPLLAQRSQWFSTALYNKPAISRVPLSWDLGFHRVRREPDANPWDGWDEHIDPDLRMIHLHRADFDVCKERHRRLSSREWNPEDLEQGFAAHNRVTEDAEFEAWFYRGLSWDGKESDEFKPTDLLLEEIGAEWKAVL